MIAGLLAGGVLAGGVLAGGEDQQKAAPLGLFVLLLIGVACYFLFKSMSRHLKRVRENFPESGRPTVPTTDRPASDATAAHRTPGTTRPGPPPSP